MPISPYGGMIFASLAAIGGLLQAQVLAAPSNPAEIILSEDQSVVLDEVRAVCANSDVEITKASADPSTGTSLHVALVDGRGNFRADGSVAIARGERRREMRLRCRGDWLMMNMRPGQYVIKAEVDGRLRTRTVDVPEFGRVRLAMNMGGVPNS
jgi:hypothetical protein